MSRSRRSPAREVEDESGDLAATEERWRERLETTERSRAGRVHVREVMSDPITVQADTTLDELVTLFVDRGIGGVPVLDGEGKPIGVVSKTDLIAARARRLDAAPEPAAELRTAKGKKLPRRGFHEESPSTLTASDLMTPLVFSIAGAATLAEAAALMAEKRVHRVVVVSDTGHVIGIVSALDLVCWLSGAKKGSQRPARKSAGRKR